MMVDQNIFRAYDIRGIAMGAAATLTPDVAELIGKAAGTYLLRKGFNQMVVGRDGRVTSPELQKRFIGGALSVGMNVTNIGLAVSPMLYFATCVEGYDCGVNITASHNPKEYNGFKIVGDGAKSICGDELQIIYKMIENEDFADGNGIYTEQDVWPEYKSKLLSQVKIERPLKVVFDAANGVAGAFIKDLFDSAGVGGTYLFTEVDGDFPNHEANPEIVENVQDIIAKVAEIGADLGVGYDGDGDRIGIVDENGKFYSADLLLLLLSRDLLKRQPGAKIVFDTKCSRVLENDIKARGGVPLRSATGHSFIEARMHQEGALLGGEISGHMFFGENYYGFDDSFLATLKFLEILSNADMPFSALFADVPQVFNTPEIKLPCPDDRKFEIVREVTQWFLDNDYDCLTMDGVFVSLDDSTWGAVRCSNTSPNLTLRFEADTEEKLQGVRDLFRGVLAKYPELSINGVL